MGKVAKGSAFDLKNYIPLLKPEPKKPIPPPPKRHQRLDVEKLPVRMNDVQRKSG